MMKTKLEFVAIFLAACPGLSAQVAPGATAGGADLRYTLRYSQSVEFGGDLGDWQTINPSGELDYTNRNSKHPLVVDYTGGYLATLEGPEYGDGMFHHLLLSQGLAWPKWNLLASDSVSYSPEAPTTGFSGIPGIGESIGEPNPAPSSQSILTLNSHVIENTATGTLNHILNFATSISLGGSSDLLRYPGSDLLDTDSQRANGGLNFRINARNSLSAQYMFSQFSYPSYSLAFISNSMMFGFQRSWTRAVSSVVSMGPEWTGSSDGTAIPSSTAVGVQAAITYQLRSGSAAVAYTRGITGGSGYLMGAESDTITGTLSREFQDKVTVGLSGGYMRNTGLGSTTAIAAEYGGIQASRPVGRFLSVFANYTATTQSSAGPLPVNILNQLTQGISFGMAYSRDTNPSR